MKQRCSNSKDPNYLGYGGRGIKVCDEWQTFENFWRDMGASYREGLSIDRIDNDGNYEPSNCRWATQAQQMNNTRGNVRMSTGETMSEYARRRTVSASTLRNQKKRGVSLKEMEARYG